MNSIHERFHKCRAFLSAQTFSQIGNQFLRPQSLQHLSGSLSYCFRSLGSFLILDQFARIVVSLQCNSVSYDPPRCTSVDTTINRDDIKLQLGQVGIGKATRRRKGRRKCMSYRYPSKPSMQYICDNSPGTPAEYHQGNIWESNLELFGDLLETGKGKLIEILLVNHHSHGFEDL
jgi:hypothetical protein